MEKQKHPRGLYVLFFTEMWERFGFYSMLAMFTLYLRNDEQGFSWTAESATRLYSIYLMFVYASPLFGGWIADRKFGYRNSVLLGGLIFMVGYFMLAIPALWAVYLALALLVVGNGFFKPNVSAMVGQLYPEGSPLKDRAYNIFYMGINIGALLAPINAEFMVRWFGFNVAFAIAGVGMIFSVAILWSFKHYIEEARGRATLPEDPEPAPASAGIGIPATHAEPSPMESVPEGRRIGALIVVFLIAIVFWMVFHQNGSTLTYWANDNTDWQVTGIISNAINPFWVVTLTFPLVWFWRWLASKGMEPSTPTKMAFGMFLCAGSFAILYFAARTGEAKEVRPEMYARGSFRVTDQVLNTLKAEGVPEDVLEKLRKKNDRGNFIVKGRKFSPDSKFSGALATIQQDLKDEVSEEDWKVLKESRIEKQDDAPLAGGRKFSAALEKVVAELKEKGLSDEAAKKMLAYRDKKFDGAEKLLDAVGRVLTPEEVSKYGDLLLRRSYLYQVSPLWLIIAYMVVTLGELMLSPMGLSLVSKVAPVRLRGLMMGGWFLATAVGNGLTMIGVYWDRWLHSTFFAVLGSMALIMAIVLVLLLRPLKKAMPGV